MKSHFVISLFATLSAIQFIRASPAGVKVTGSHPVGVFKLCLFFKGTKSSIFIERDNNSKIYQELNYQWNTVKPNIYPMGYFLPEKASDIQAGLHCARKWNIQMVAKSGGHSYEKYSFGNKNSVVIDLRKLDFIRVDKKTKTADVGAGVLFGTLYWEIWANGEFGIPGPNCITVGVGGLTLGGGDGFMSKKFGLTSDQVLEMDMVDANGKLHTVNSKSNKDLFWALRGGGGGNFGIVTRFKYKLFDTSKFKVTYIVFVYPVEMFKKVFKAWQALNIREKNEDSFERFVALPDQLEVYVTGINLNQEEIEYIRNSFPSNTTTYTSTTYAKFIDFTVAFSEPAVQPPSQLKFTARQNVSSHYYRAKSYFSSKKLQDPEVKELETVLSRVPPSCFVQFNSYGGAISAVKADATSFVHRDSLYKIQVGIGSNDNSTVQWVREFDSVSRKILDNGESYQNYVDSELKDYPKRFYGKNLARLVQIKKKTDPTNYFSFEQAIPPNS